MPVRPDVGDALAHGGDHRLALLEAALPDELPRGSRARIILKLVNTGFTAPVTLPPLGESVSPLVLVINRKDYGGPFDFTVEVSNAGRTFTLSRSVEFMGPDARLLEEEDHEQGIKR
jgi:hypothetical protein